MQKLFYLGIAGLILFEIANVYFIMPMPGSQRMNSLDWAYTLYHYRWVCRLIFGALVVVGAMPAWQSSKWKTGIAFLLAAGITWLFNFVMAADKMFYPPQTLRMATAANNAIKPEKLVLGVTRNGQAKAYPIQLLGYHHQVFDTIGGEPVLVTYCTVCRTGRVYAPTVNGKPETFRLVGMDHFNAMFEDATTKSWWRQASGEAVAGPLKGSQLPEIPSTQSSLRAWLELNPGSQIMQRDEAFSAEYDSLDTYDFGLKRGKLTRTDTVSWNDKAWVVGISTDNKSAKAYDWNRLKKERVILDQIGNQAIMLVISAENAGFAAFKRSSSAEEFTFRNDSIYQGEKRWDLLGRAADPAYSNLIKIPAYQEFWHSWRTFHPYTTRY